jgi:tetratricopeptide (TPR) repeat protein
MQRRNYGAARSYLTKALDSNPADVRSLEALARTYAEQGQVATAYQKLKEYAARSPKSSEVQLYLGEQLEISGDLSETRKAFMAAKAADPTDTRANLALAQLDLREGHLEEARKGVLAVMASGRDALPGSLMLGDIETKAGNYSAAIEHYRKALDINPRSVRALNDLAYLLVEHQNQPDQALKYAQTAAEIVPEDPAVKDTIGWVYYHKGVYLTAAQFLKSAAEKPDMIIAKYHLGMTYVKAGERDLGRQELEAALKTNPNLPEAQTARELLKSIGAAK